MSGAGDRVELEGIAQRMGKSRLRSRLYELMDCGELVYVKIGQSRRIPRRAAVELAVRSLQGDTKAHHPPGPTGCT